MWVSCFIRVWRSRLLIMVMWWCATKEVLNKLQLVQNRACRVILKERKGANVDNMHKCLNLMKLSDRSDLHMNCLCHKNIYSESKTGLDRFFKRVDQGARVTRYANNMNMKVKVFRSDKGRQAISYRGPMSWNQLSNDLKSINKFASFKKQLVARITDIWDNHSV